MGPHSDKRGFSDPHPVFLLWRLLPQSHWQRSEGRSRGLEGPRANTLTAGSRPVLRGAFWKQLLGLPGLLRATALSLPKYSSSLAPFRCTPLADDSMRKCRTRSLLSSPVNGTEGSVSTGTRAVGLPLPPPAHPGGPSQGIRRSFCSARRAWCQPLCRGGMGTHRPRCQHQSHNPSCGFSACFRLPAFS